MQLCKSPLGEIVAIKYLHFFHVVLYSGSEPSPVMGTLTADHGISQGDLRKLGCGRVCRGMGASTLAMTSGGVRKMWKTKFFSEVEGLDLD